MGCSNNRAKLSAAEQRFALGEQELQYTHLDCTKVDLIHRKYSYNSAINENQWLNINRHLYLSLNNPRSYFFQQIRTYYDQYKESEVYILQPLLCLGIILSQGSETTKSTLIFEAFVPNGSNKISRQGVTDIFETIFDVFVLKGEKLLKDNEEEKVSLSEHEEFVKRMKAGKEELREKFVQGILGSENFVELRKFVKWFTEGGNKRFMDSNGFRRELRKAANKKKGKKFELVIK